MIRNIKNPFLSVPPMFWIPSQLEGAYVGKDVTLECHSEAFPKSINYWVKEDGAMLISSKSRGVGFRLIQFLKTGFCAY
jgi:hypothetical protein